MTDTQRHFCSYRCQEAWHEAADAPPVQGEMMMRPSSGRRAVRRGSDDDDDEDEDVDERPKPNSGRQGHM